MTEMFLWSLKSGFLSRGKLRGGKETFLTSYGNVNGSSKLYNDDCDGTDNVSIPD